MTRLAFALTAVVCLLAVGVPYASAQPVFYNVSTYSGNGQLVCIDCTGYRAYEPLVVRVTDVNGVPVAGLTLAWNVASGAVQVGSTSTMTDANGMSSNTYLPNSYFTTYGNGQVTASVVGVGDMTGNVTAVFFETATRANSQTQVVYSSLPTSLTGVTGTTAAQPIQVSVGTSSAALPYVEVRLVSNQGSPSVTCATGAGADPGTVLTDATGKATCYPVFAGIGTGQFSVLVGGVAASSSTGGPAGFSQSSLIPLTSTGTQGSAIKIVSGNGQSGSTGQQLVNPLVAMVQDGSGAAVPGQAVTWSVSPATAALLVQTASVSDSGGMVQTWVQFSDSAAGTVKVTVAEASNSNVQATFTLTALSVATGVGLAKVSGDSQTVASGQTFPVPLVVQLTSTSGVMPGVTVNYNVTGPVTISAASVVTNSSGQAQVTVLAGIVTTPTTATVVAVIPTASGTLSQTFHLIVLPPGPVLSTFVNAADQQAGSLSPCSLATVTGSGFATGVEGTVSGGSVGPWPTTLLGNTLKVNGTLAPIFSISSVSGQQSITFQVPCETTPGSGVPVTVASVAGGQSTVAVPVQATSPGIYGVVTNGQLRVALVRPDGSFVSLTNPARRGESVKAFVTGLGAASPSVGTNQLPPPDVQAIATAVVVPAVQGSGAILNYARLSSDQVGVWEISFVVPVTTLVGNSVPFSLGVVASGSTAAQFSALGYFPVQ